MPVGARVAERASARASVRVNSTGSSQPCTPQTSSERAVVSDCGGCLLCTSEPVAFWPTRGGGVTFFFFFDMLGFPAFSVGSLLSVLLLLPIVFFIIIIIFSWSVLHALCSNVRSEMVGTRGKRICVISFSERDGSEQPCSLFVLFELCKSLFSQAEPLDRIHS